MKTDRPAATGQGRRGRPPGPTRTYADARKQLIRAGMALLTGQGLVATGLDGLLKQAGVPKGSFYHYFDSKDAFGRAVLESYATYFRLRLDRRLLDKNLPPLERLAAFVRDAGTGMARYGFQRGCLVGNLGQEITLLPGDYRELLENILQDWQQRVAACLELARQQGQLAATADCGQLAQFFWIGWEGAVMRARLVREASPLEIFFQGFLAGLPR